MALKNKGKIGTALIFVALFAVVFKNCINRPFPIADYYMIYSDDEFGDGHYLICKLGCENDPFIENIKSIQWDKRHIIVEQQEKEKSNWYLIIARGEELLCCNRDTTIGAVSKAEIDSLLKEKNINIKKMKKKHF